MGQQREGGREGGRSNKKMYQLYLSDTDGDGESQCIAHTCLTDVNEFILHSSSSQLVYQGGGSQAFRWCRKPIKGERT